MRKAATALLLSAVVLNCAPSGELAESQGDIESMASASEIRRVLDSYYTAFSARDWPRFEDHFWPGATMTTIWIPAGETAERVVATAIPDFVAQAPQGPGSREIFEERLVSTQIRVEGNLAQAWTRYHARFGDPGDIMQWDGVDAFTLLQYNSEWKIATLAYIPDSE